MSNQVAKSSKDFFAMPNGHKIGESTTKLNVTDFASYVNKVEAYAVTELGVIFEEHQRY